MAPCLEEFYYGCLLYTSGGGILKKILARLPSPDSPAAIQAFLASLPQPERDALNLLNLDPVPIPDVARSVQEACSGIAKAALERHIDVYKRQA